MSEVSQKRSHLHRVVGYLSPGDKSFIVKYANIHKVSESNALKQAVRLLKQVNSPVISSK